jgi:hypothetical protein
MRLLDDLGRCSLAMCTSSRCRGKTSRSRKMERRSLRVLRSGPGAAFKKMGNETMLMGDLVLTEDEIEPVMLKLQQGGIEQTAIHNHLLGETPHIIYMHIVGHGDVVELASSLSSTLALTKTPGGSSPKASKVVEALAEAAPAAAPEPTQLDVKGIGRVLLFGGKMINGNLLQFGIPRREKITDNSMEIPPSMGTAIAINFQPTSEGKTAISGDFVLLASEVNPVIRGLRMHGIEVEAVHNHMLNDEPHLYFMHFWANDNAIKLAHGLRAALDETNSVKPEEF